MRRSTAHRASNRRAAARELRDDIEERILGYVQDRPQSTTGDMAKGLNADRGAIAAGLSHMMSTGEVSKRPDGEIEITHAPSDR